MTVVNNSGIMNVGNFYGAVTSIINASPATPDDLKAKLTMLGSELDRIKDRIPAEAAATLGDDVENLSREATKAKRPSMLRTFGENILAALKGAAEVATPAAALVHEILVLTGAAV